MQNLLPTLLLAVLAAPPEAVDPEHAAKIARGLDVFARHVRPVLVETCLRCHGGDKTRSGFDLTTREGLLKGGDHGRTVVPGKSKESRLVRLIDHLDEPPMPPQAPKLPAAAVRRFADWIDLGAPYDKPLLDRDLAAKKPLVVTDEDRSFWSFQPLRQPAVPAVKDEGWCRTPLDRFVLARLEAKGLKANAIADRRKLIRRASFDLIGLPPPPEEVEAFVKDQDPRAYEKLIDRLLASPHFGERWARHWLDLARFAESHGFEHDTDRPTAYHYRDFVIQAFNQNLPYDVFVKWQIAGDELAPDDSLALAATGFLAAGVHSTQITANQVEKERYDELDDIVRTIGTSMLGLTVGCARCHDHKYDPIPIRDYYRLLSTFTTTVRTEVAVDPVAAKEAQRQFEVLIKGYENQLQKLREGSLGSRFESWLASGGQTGKPTQEPPKDLQETLKLFQPDAKVKATPTQRKTLWQWFAGFDAEWQRLSKELEAHRKAGPKFPKMLISSEGLPALRLHSQGADFFNETYFLKRGDPNQKDGVATQSFLQVLMRNPDAEKRWPAAPPAGSRLSYRRRALAAWITDVDQGAGSLLARVIVNRLWQHYLGRGLVNTPSDFGWQGDRPTHPELLDWLARELVDHGWNLKHIHRLILSSAVAMQGSRHDKDRATVDPDNKLCWRRSPRRLEAEAIRDSLLAVSGTLDPRPFGPGTLDPNHQRRAIYFFVKRSQLVPSMVLFDGPDGLQGIEQRQTTTIAPQALLLMNNRLVRRCAENFARRVVGNGQPAEDAVRQGYTIALGRPPSGVELAKSVSLLEEQAASYEMAGKAGAQHLALTDFCQVLLGLNEFIYVD